MTPGDLTDLGTPGRKHISYAAGWKLKEDAWSPGENESVFLGVDFDRELQSFPAWLVAKILVGTGDVPEFVTAPDADSTGTAELCVGLRKYGSLGRTEPFASAGVAWLTGGITGYKEETADAFSIGEESTLGVWADVGIQVPVTRSFTLGFIAHHSVGSEVQIEGSGLELGGTSLLFTLGVRR